MSSAEILKRVGWARSVGGSNPYLTLYSRGRIGARQAEADVRNRSIAELPSARGCTHFLPADDFSLGLIVGQGFSEAAAISKAKKFLGVTDKEIDTLCSAVLDVLRSEALDPKDIREMVGSACRNLGEEGKKRGQTTTMSLALGKLQSIGEILRVPINGRLDTQRFGYVRWSHSPLQKSKRSRDECFAELARRYFEWTGCATIAHFRWFSGLGVGAAKRAIEDLPLVNIFEDWFALQEKWEKFEQFKTPKKPCYRLISSIDSLLLMRRDVMNFVGDSDSQKQMATEKGLKLIGGVQDLENNAIVDRGRIVGLWEFDSEASKIIAVCFEKRSPELDREIMITEEFIRNDLGDVRSFSLDSPKSRVPKLDALRKLDRA